MKEPTYMRQGPGLSAVALFLLLPALAWTTPLSMETEQQKLTFSTNGATPVSWEAGFPSLRHADARMAFCTPDTPPPLRIVVQDHPELDLKIRSLPGRFEDAGTEAGTSLRFTSTPFLPGVFLVTTFTLAGKNSVLTLHVQIKGESAGEFIAGHTWGLVLEPGTDFFPSHSAGFGAGYETVRALLIENQELRELPQHPESPWSPIPVNSRCWAGFRNRFWCIMANPQSENTSLLPLQHGDNQQLLLTAPGRTDLSLNLYAGPLDYYAFRDKSPPLTPLFFDMLWFWMRWLSFGLLFLLDGIIVVVRNEALAIILLSLLVKVLMHPLTALADRWQREVNEKKSRLQPHIDTIKAAHRGEEQTRRIVQLYEQLNIHPLFALKSLFGVMIQIPIFFAAYHMLSENILLSGAGFLWITDLARPDALFTLPFRIPFFGSDFNLFPFLMTATTVLSSWQFDDGSLSRDLLEKQRRNLYWMALAFFVLFYTFPAGMVLYWTTNNVVMLVKFQFSRLWRRRRKPPLTPEAGI